MRKTIIEDPDAKYDCNGCKKLMSVEHILLRKINLRSDDKFLRFCSIKCMKEYFKEKEII